MKIIALAVLICAATAANADLTSCPSHCTCKLEGASGMGAFCTRLDPSEQHFTDPIQHLTVANVNNSKLQLPDNIFALLGLKDLESIKIVNTSLADISYKAFQGLASLFDVNLSNNQIFLIHVDTFANNNNLHRLKLSGNPMQLTQVLKSPTDALLRSSSLTDFDLSNCQLSQILPKTFSQLKNLVFINLSSNYLRSIPKDVFEGLDALEDLDLSNNSISKVDRNVFKLNKNLSVLKLRNNPIELLNGIELAELEELYLNDCKLRVLMKETIEGMPQLTLLNLSSNKIEVISDDSFTDLTELKQLDLSNNRLIGPIPRDLFKNNRRLETLSLSGNKDLGMLVEDTGFLDNHPAMTKLEIADCGLTILTNAHLRGMNNLNILNVSHNSIKTLDSVAFANLKSLNYLDLSYNKIQTIPTAMFAMNVDLVKLWLAGNPLKQLPLYTFSYTTNLKFLDVSNCALEKLWDQHKHQPDGHKILSNLAFLDISRNNITNLHIWDFHSMEKLETIDMSGNPIQCVSPTIQLIEYFIKNEVDPHHQYEKIQENGKEEKLKWNDIILGICPVRAIDQAQTSVKSEKVTRTEIDRDFLPVVENARNTFTTVDEILVEDSSSSSINSSIMWPTILAASILIVALYLIIYLVGEITHRRRALAATYARPGSLGGHARTRGASGSPLYYKLYEECSIPAQPVKTKKNHVLDFSPIHTILKKGTYKIMKTNEVNV